MMCMPVDQLHSRAKSFVTKFRQGGGTNYIDEAIILTRQALELSPPGHRKRDVCLMSLGIHLHDCYDQLGGMIV